MDTLRVFGLRIFRGRSPFSPDRNHIHHLFLSRGFQHKSVTLICVLSTVIISVIAFSLQKLGTTQLIAFMVALFFSFVYVLSYKKSKYKLHAIKGEVKPAEEDKSVKLVALFDKQGAVVEEE